MLRAALLHGIFEASCSHPTIHARSSPRMISSSWQDPPDGCGTARCYSSRSMCKKNSRFEYDCREAVLRSSLMCAVRCDQDLFVHSLWTRTTTHLRVRSIEDRHLSAGRGGRMAPPEESCAASARSNLETGDGAALGIKRRKHVRIVPSLPRVASLQHDQERAFLFGIHPVLKIFPNSCRVSASCCSAPHAT